MIDASHSENSGLIRSPRRPEIPGDGPQSVAHLLDPWVALHPQRLALVGRRGRLTYAELDRDVDRAAAALHRLGLEAGDRLAACLPNDVDIVIAFLASQRLGLIWVGLNRVLSASEKRYILEDCDARALLAPSEVIAELRSDASDEPLLKHWIDVDATAESDTWRRLLQDSNARAPAVAIDPFAPAAIAYTSGTTGFPKGAVHSQHNLLLPGAVARDTGNRPAPEKHGVVLPLTILNLIVLGPICIFYDGRCCVCMDRIDAEGVAQWVREEEIGSFDGVPTIIHDLLTHPGVATSDLVSLTQPIMGGADSPPEVVSLFRQRFGGEVIIGYGMTEAPTAVTWSDGSTPPGPGLCGRPVPQVEIEIVDDDGGVVADRTVGEICVRPARAGRWRNVYTPMLGYWNKPEETERALRGDRYHTGDLGEFAADGNLYIRGRRNELILRGGANVYPAEIERVLNAQPGVAASACLGVPDERLGQRVVAVVEMADHQAFDEATLVSATAAALARYKVPERVLCVPTMPRNAMNKIVKPRLTELFEAAESRTTQDERPDPERSQ